MTGEMNVIKTVGLKNMVEPVPDKDRRLRMYAAEAAFDYRPGLGTNYEKYAEAEMRILLGL